VDKSGGDATTIRPHPKPAPKRKNPNAYRTPGDPGDGSCTYCDRYGPRTNDHVLPRSTFPQYRNERRNLVPACWWCNRKREDSTWKPKWASLPRTVREWALSAELPGRLQRLFEGVPDG
jgi:5-methylcytosine-specific restriction endonuclease McrA